MSLAGLVQAAKTGTLTARQTHLSHGFRFKSGTTAIPKSGITGIAYLATKLGSKGPWTKNATGMATMRRTVTPNADKPRAWGENLVHEGK